MMGQRFADRAVIVTGAGSGIGQGIALRFAAEGARVVVNDLTDDRAQGTIGCIEAAGGTAASSVGDVSERDVAERLLATAIDSFGRVDALVNNAGILTMAPLLELTDDDWDRVMRVNVRSVFVCTQVVARHWVTAGTGGRVVNIASTTAEMASPMGLGHYASSKGAVRMFTRSAALELAPHRITVNAIGPGTVPSGITSGEVVSATDAAGASAEPTPMVPIGRMGTPDDIANLAAFMCSDVADYMTGQLVMLDGGRNLTSGDPRGPS
jgi:NAD(P)-dependent dehydrogenase (short-subunit alcohol dehydrogenase family)